MKTQLEKRKGQRKKDNYLSSVCPKMHISPSGRLGWKTFYSRGLATGTAIHYVCIRICDINKDMALPVIVTLELSRPFFGTFKNSQHPTYYFWSVYVARVLSFLGRSHQTAHSYFTEWEQSTGRCCLMLPPYQSLGVLSPTKPC